MTDQQPDPAPDAADSHPVLRIVSGNPDPAEIAAVTAVLVAVAAARTERQPAPVGNAWGELALRLRRPPVAGPGAWQHSVWS
ncbi:MAG: acyl-CoA carboxylase subunit epsilon [Jatrophihabitantaceae bacterium]